jgi:hypothetical protein
MMCAFWRTDGRLERPETRGVTPVRRGTALGANTRYLRAFAADTVRRISGAAAGRGSHPLRAGVGAMQSEAAAKAMEHDGVLPDTLVVLVDA